MQEAERVMARWSAVTRGSIVAMRRDRDPHRRACPQALRHRDRSAATCVGDCSGNCVAHRAWTVSRCAIPANSLATADTYRAGRILESGFEGFLLGDCEY